MNIQDGDKVKLERKVVVVEKENKFYTISMILGFVFSIFGIGLILSGLGNLLQMFFGFFIGTIGVLFFLLSFKFEEKYKHYYIIKKLK